MVSGDLLEGPSRGRKPRRRRGPPPSRVRQAAGVPTVSGHIVEAVASSRERRGLSLAGVKKALSAAGYDVPRINSRVNQAVRSLVSGGSLLQTAGTGTSGSFRINRQHLEGQSRASAAPKAQGGGRPRRRAAAGPRAKVKRSPARLKKKPRGGRRKGAAAGGGRRKRAKATGVRRLGGRLRKARKEPAPEGDPAAGQEGEEEAAATERETEGATGRQEGKTVKEEK